jgi:hypothetical protein
MRGRRHPLARGRLVLRGEQRRKGVDHGHLNGGSHLLVKLDLHSCSLILPPNAKDLIALRRCDATGGSSDPVAAGRINPG